ncbi:MAG: stage III sporulation protein AB [bacterium]|nr:stage III sporulation protein AB [bacterium]
MIKMIGVLLVIGSSTAIGLYFSTMTKGRVKDLKVLKKYIILLRGDIEYSSTPLPEAIEMLSRRSNDRFKEFFEKVASELRKLDGIPFTEIWDKGIRENMNEIFLTEPDKDLLRKLGDTLGFMDKDMQVKSIDLYLEQLELELAEAIKTEKEKTRLYNLLGVLCGIFITVVLI